MKTGAKRTKTRKSAITNNTKEHSMPIRIPMRLLNWAAEQARNQAASIDNNRATNTPPCPPGHCEECTGDCPDGAPAASEQASSEDARQKELDDALASVGFKKLVSGVSPMQGYMMMKAASEQAPAQESK
jgi:hypothetical protein